MLRPRGLCGLEAKLFGLGLILSGLGLVASGLGLIEVGLVASKFAAYMDWLITQFTVFTIQPSTFTPVVYWLLT